MKGRHDLMEPERAQIPLWRLNKPRGVPRLDERRMISSIFHLPYALARARRAAV
jgi:hypothetical protein